MPRYQLCVNGYPSLYHGLFDTRQEVEKEIERLEKIKLETNKKFQDHMARPVTERSKGDSFRFMEDTRKFSIKELM